MFRYFVIERARQVLEPTKTKVVGVFPAKFMTPEAAQLVADEMNATVLDPVLIQYPKSTLMRFEVHGINEPLFRETVEQRRSGRPTFFHPVP